jgi:hypothetical protein
MFEGYSSNFVRVMVDTNQDLSNEIREVFVSKMVGDKLFGELVN